MAKTDEPKPVTLAEIQRALLTKIRSKECNGQGALGIAQWLAGTILGEKGDDPDRVLGAPAPDGDES